MTVTAWTRWILGAAAAALLYVGYWRLSWSAPANSDSAAAVLQARDVLHGNLLLHGWRLSDVSFWTTEVPQYTLLMAVLGVGAAVVHVAAAMSYLLIVVLVALLAAGPAGAAPAAARCVRALVAAAIVAAPQASAAQVILLGPDHTGTVVPVLAVWLLIDRRWPRWWVPAAACAALTLIMVADAVVLFTAVVPLTVTALTRFSRGRDELSLAVAAGLAACLALVIPWVAAEAGGYRAARPSTHVAALRAVPHDLRDTILGVLELFGGNVFAPQSPGEAVLAWLHLAGLALAVAGVVVALSRLASAGSPVMPVLAVAIVVQLAAYLVSTHHSANLGSIREIVAVMPFGAVLAGRTLASLVWPVRRAAAAVPGHRQPHLPAGAVLAGAVLAGCVGGLAYDATRPPVPSANQDLAGWLSARHLANGLAAYWQAGSITLDTAGQVHVAPVIITRHGTIGPYTWESARSDYDPSVHPATFLIAGGPAATAPIAGLAQVAIRTFGPPWQHYRYGPYEVLIWHTSILNNMTR